MVESMSSESESDTLIYENVVEIKQKKKKNGTPGGMIHSSVNVGGQVKYLKIYVILWDKQSSYFFLQMKKYSAESPDSHTQHTSSIVNVTKVEWDWLCRGNIVLCVGFEVASCGCSYCMLGFTVKKLRKLLCRSRKWSFIGRDSSQARIKPVWQLSDE